MGSIKRSFANNLSTGGVFTSSAITNTSVTGITTLANAPADSITLISSQTASASASISFTTGLDSTYKAYKFVFINVKPATDAAEFQFNMSTDSGSNYNVTKTTTFFNSRHSEDDTSEAGLAYFTDNDLAQSTAFQDIYVNAGNGADENVSGELSLFNPSSTTYVKHFIARVQGYHNADSSFEYYIAGYGNTTSAINAIQFKMSSGNFDGTIYLYGIK